MTLNRPLQRIAGLCVLFAQLTACYSVREMAVAVPAPATRVIAQITDSGTVAMANAIGPGAVEVEGIVAQADATAWTLRLLRVDQRGGFSTSWNQEEVVFPRYAITRIAEKRLDRKKSWVFAGLLTAAAVLVGTAFGVLTIGGEQTPPPPPPQ